MKFLRYSILPIAFFSIFSTINAMDMNSNFNKKIVVLLCKNCRKKPRYQGFEFCGKTCGRNYNYQQNNINNNNNKNVNNNNKRSLNNNNINNNTNNIQQKKKNKIQRCATLRCTRSCAQNPNGGFFDYCDKLCVSKGQLCLTQGCYNGCTKNGNSYYDYCSLICKNSNNINQNINNNNNQYNYIQLNNNNNQLTCALNGCNQPVYQSFLYCSKKHGQQAKLGNNYNYNQQKMCIVCKVKPVNTQFPGTLYCGNSCRNGNNNNNNQNNNINNNHHVRPAVFTYLKSKNLQINNVELFYDAKTHPQNYIFCNFYPCKITIGGITYDNAEAAFQAGKTYPNGAPFALQNANGDQAFQLGKGGQWSYKGENEDRMKAVLHAKFTQNILLGQFLKNTHNKHLIEDSDRDAFWGIGLNGIGSNMLGELLMQLRSQI